MGQNDSTNQKWQILYQPSERRDQRNHGMAPFPDICRAYTQGLRENFQHPELEIVLDHIGYEGIAAVLNIVASAVADGIVLTGDGDTIDYPTKTPGKSLRMFGWTPGNAHCEEQRMIRIILPDSDGNLPFLISEKMCNHPSILAQLIPSEYLFSGLRYETVAALYPPQYREYAKYIMGRFLTPLNDGEQCEGMTVPANQEDAELSAISHLHLYQQQAGSTTNSTYDAAAAATPTPFTESLLTFRPSTLTGVYEVDGHAVLLLNLRFAR